MSNPRDKSNPNDKVKVPDNASKKSDQPKPNATANQTHPKQVQDENSDIVQQNFVRTNEGTVVGQAQETQQHPMQQQQQQPQEGWPGIEELCNIPNDNVPLQSSQSQWPQLGQSIESIIRERTNSERPNRGRGSNWLGGKRQNVRRPYRGHSRGRRPVWNPNDPYHRQRQFAKKYITQTDQYTKYHVPLPKPEPNPENGETKPIPLDIYFPNTRKIIHKCRVMFKFVDKKVTYIKIEFRFHDAPQFDRPKYYEYIELMRPIVPLLGNPVPNERGHKFDDGDKRNLRYVKEFPISDIIFISTLFNRSIGYWFYSFCINSGLRIVIMGLLYPWIKEAIPMEQVVAPEHLNPNICGENQTYLIGSGQMSNPIFTMEKKYELRRYIYQWVYQFTELYWDSLSREQCTDSMRRELENFKSVIMVKYESYGRIEPPKWDDLLSEPIDTTIHHTQEEHRQVRPVFGFSNIDGKYFLYQSRNDTWKMLNNIQFIGAKMEDIQPSPNRRLVFAFEVNVSSGVHIPIGDVHFWRIAYLGQYNSLTIYYYNKPFYVHIQCRFAIDLYRLVVSFENWIGFDIKYIDNNRSFIGKRLAPIKETFEHIFSRIFPGCYVPEFRTFHQRLTHSYPCNAEYHTINDERYNTHTAVAREYKRFYRLLCHKFGFNQLLLLTNNNGQLDHQWIVSCSLYRSAIRSLSNIYGVKAPFVYQLLKFMDYRQMVKKDDNEYIFNSNYRRLSALENIKFLDSEDIRQFKKNKVNSHIVDMEWKFGTILAPLFSILPSN